MSSLTITSVAQADQPRVIATLVSAFIADPVERWLYPQPLAYPTEFPAFVAAFGGEAFESETVWSLDDFAAAAMWLPPGVQADAIVKVLSESVSTEKHTDTFSVLEQMDAAHPTDPHWYLPWLGVDGARQGAGAQLRRPRLDAYLTSASVRDDGVRHVDPAGPAAASGIRPGDLLRTANRRPLRSRHDLDLALNRSREQRRALALEITRGTEPMRVLLTARTTRSDETAS